MCFVFILAKMILHFLYSLDSVSILRKVDVNRLLHKIAYLKIHPVHTSVRQKRLLVHSMGLCGFSMGFVWVLQHLHDEKGCFIVFLGQIFMKHKRQWLVHVLGILELEFPVIPLWWRRVVLWDVSQGEASKTCGSRNLTSWFSSADGLCILHKMHSFDHVIRSIYWSFPHRHHRYTFKILKSSFCGDTSGICRIIFEESTSGMWADRADWVCVTSWFGPSAVHKF